MEEQFNELAGKFRSFFISTESRLQKLETIHTAYQGRQGDKGDRGEKGDPGKDGQSADLTQFRNECNALREELHAIRSEIVNQLAEDYRRYVAELGKMYENEVEAFCALRDEAAKGVK